MAETICWFCDKSGKGECSWDAELVPVPGWRATPVMVPSGINRIPVQSFIVNDCPEYVAPDYLAAAGRISPPSAREMTYWAYTGLSRSDITRHCMMQSRAENALKSEGESV